MKSKKEIKEEYLKKHFAATAKIMIEESGFESVSARKIAEMAGYSCATLYNHFGSMDNLLWYTRSVMIEDVLSYMKSSSGNSPEAGELAKNSLRNYAGYFLKHKNTFRFFFFHQLNKSSNDTGPYLENPEMIEMNDEIVNLLGKERGLTGREINTVMKTIIHSIHGMLMLLICSNDDSTYPEMESDINDMVDYLLDGKLGNRQRKL